MSYVLANALFMGVTDWYSEPSIHVSIPIIPVVPAEVPIVPADPLVTPEDSLPPAPELPLVSPFLCSDDSEADSKSEPAEQRPERHESLVVHDAMVWRWMDRVASRPSSLPRSSSPITFALSSEFPVSLVVAPPEIHRRPVILIRPGESIPFGRPYRTHPNKSRSSASSLSSDSSSDTSSGSPSDSLSDTSSVHSSGCNSSGKSHSGPSTIVASPRSAPLSTPYPPTTSESSLDSSSARSLDSSSPFAGPSRKRCRFPTTLVPSSTPVSGSIAPIQVDLLPPRKRFRDSYSPEDSREEHMEIGTTNTEAVADLGIGDGVGAHTEDGIEASAGGTMEIAIDPLVTGGISESTEGDAPDLKGTLYDIAHYMSEVSLDRITEFETAQRQLEAGQLMASGDRASLADRIRRLGRENLRVRALLCIERDRVDSLHHHMALSQEEFHQIRRDRDDTQRRLRRLESLVEMHLGFHP
ncbi:hypothetical protein Tco_0662867 [Tanacetum coccineum]